MIPIAPEPVELSGVGHEVRLDEPFAGVRVHHPAAIILADSETSAHSNSRDPSRAHPAAMSVVIEVESELASASAAHDVANNADDAASESSDDDCEYVAMLNTMQAALLTPVEPMAPSDVAVSLPGNDAVDADLQDAVNAAAAALDIASDDGSVCLR